MSQTILQVMVQLTMSEGSEQGTAPDQSSESVQDEFDLTVNSIVTSMADKAELAVYPNPVSGTLTVRTKDSSLARIRVTSISGIDSPVEVTGKAANETIISTVNWSTRVYFIELFATN